MRYESVDQAVCRYHDFYRRHRFAKTRKKGGWDVLSLESQKDEKRLKFAPGSEAF